MQHQALARRLLERDDRFSQLLAKQLQDEHHGQYLLTRSGLTAEEHQELLAMVDDAHAAFREELHVALKTLRELLSQGDPLYTVATIQATTLLSGWGGYYEPTQERGENRVELVAGLICSQPVATNLEPAPAHVMQLIHDELDHIVLLLLLFNLTLRGREESGAAELRFTGSMQWMTLRGTSFADHGEQLAAEVCSPHDDWLLSSYGFTSGDVIRMGRAIVLLQQRRLNGLLEQARHFADGVTTQLETARVRAQLPPEIRAQALTEEGRFRIAGAAFMDVVEARIRDASTFTAGDLEAEVPAIARERIDAMMTELSIAIGSVDPSAYSGLFDPSPLAERPLLEHQERYMLPVPGMLVRETLTVLDGRLIRGNPSYSKSRAKTLDRLAVDYLSRLLPGATAYTNLFYADAELDGLVLFDDVAFVVEGKASAISAQARRGDVRRLANDIRDSVESAWEQGARARAYLLRGEDSVFHDDHGAEVLRIPEGTIGEVHVVNPTLHELAGHAPQLARLTAVGLFQGGELPWSVYINDLRVIAETCDNSAVFLHYLVWRARLPLGDRVFAMDELDLWASYLLGERFGMLAEEGRAMVGNATTDFDAYYDGVEGRGPKRRKPRKFLTEPVTRFVERMATERPAGWRDAAGVCLDLSIPELAAVHAQADQVARAATEQGEPLEARYGRLALVGIPREAATATYLDAAKREESDAILIIFVQQPSNAPKAVITWAEYGGAVSFELSEFEKRALNAAATSPFRPSS